MDTNNSPFVIKGTKLYKYLGNGEELIIPEGVESVKVSTFLESISHIDHFKKVVIPSTLFAIPDSIFKEKRIDELIIEEGVEIIGWSAFQGASIKKLKLPSTIKIINSYAFYGCGLEEVSLNPSIEIVREESFAYNNFSRFVYPKSLSSVDLTVLQPTQYDPNKTLEIVCDFSRIEKVTSFGEELSIKRPINFSLIISDSFNFNTVCSFLDNIKENKISTQKITLIGDNNPFYLCLLRQLVQKMGLKIEIEMIKEMDEDLLIEVVGGKKHKEEIEVLESKNIDQEVGTLVQEVKEKSSILEESLRKEILSRVDSLIQTYQKNLMELKPKLEKEDKIPLGMYKTPQSLRLDLISKLQGINMNFINLDADIYLKKKIEQYKELVNDNSVVENIEQVESIEDKIKGIKYYTSLMNQGNIKDEILKILTEIESHLLLPSLDIITLRMEKSSINYEQELENKISDLYQKVKVACAFYQSLCGTTTTSLGSDMNTLDEILSFLDEGSKSKFQERINQLKSKYLEEVKVLKIESDSEQKVREELVPILEDLKELMPNVKGRKDLLDDINNARRIIAKKNRENRKKLDDMIYELNMLLSSIQFKDSHLDAVFKETVEELLQKLNNTGNDISLEEENKKESIRETITDIQSIIRGNLDLLKNNTLNQFSSNYISNRLTDRINNYYKDREDTLPPVEIDEKKVFAITSTVRDILSSLENPIFDEVVKNQIETSLTQILNDSYQEIISGSFVIEEREDSVTKNLDWSSRATLQVLSEFHKIENFIDETIKYNEEIESFNTNHGKGA